MERFAFSLPEVPQMSGVNAACAPCANQVQEVQARQQTDQSKALDVMKDMASGKVSPEDGMKQLQALVVDQFKAQMSLLPSAPSAGSTPAASASTGFSSRDSFELPPAAKPMLDLLGAAGGGVAPAAVDASFLEGSGGGSKRGIASGAN